jgi:hypothetical protein
MNMMRQNDRPEVIKDYVKGFRIQLHWVNDGFQQ